MATRTTAGTSFPAELASEMFNKVQGHSALAKLSAEKPKFRHHLFGRAS